MPPTKTLALLLAFGAVAAFMPQAGATTAWAEVGTTCKWNDPTPYAAPDPLEKMNTPWDAETAYWAQASFGPLDMGAWIHVEGHRDGGTPQTKDDYWSLTHPSSTIEVQEGSKFKWFYGKAVQAVAQAWGAGINKVSEDADVQNAKCHDTDTQAVEAVVGWYGGVVSCDEDEAGSYALAGTLYHSESGDGSGKHYFLVPSPALGTGYAWADRVTFPCHLDALTPSGGLPLDARAFRVVSMERNESGSRVTKAGI